MRIFAVSAFGSVMLACGSSCPSGPVSEAVETCETACSDGDANACARLAVHEERGGANWMATVDNARVRAYFERACEHAGPEERWTCVAAATVPNEDNAIDHIAVEALCDEGSLAACHELVRQIPMGDAIPIELPSATREEEESPTVTVSIDVGGDLYLDAAAITLEALRSHPFAGGTRAIIAADRRAEHGRLVQVVDALRTAGVTRWALNTGGPQPSPEPPPPGE